MVQVKVSEGILEGEILDNALGGKYYSFKGIPYAEPPVGDLRFKAPQPIKPWNGTRNAKEFGPICYQVEIFLRKFDPSGSEDCLYLNVYTPDIEPTAPLPVMVWIHGGGFTSGNGTDDLYGPEFLVRHGIILVTINYRLEVLGFLCLDTEDVPGNAGLKDQVAALKWIKKNISSFGGDPENITIAGESAGGASVSLHLVSPMTKGLFKRAIIQSGTSTCWWPNSLEPRERAIALAKSLGFKSEDDKELYEFFKSQSAEKLVNVRIPITFHEKALENFGINFAVVSEKKFGDNERYFYGDVIEVLGRGIHEGVQVMNGYTSEEGMLNLAMSFPSQFENVISSANNFYEFFVPRQIANNCSVSEKIAVGKKFKSFYFKNEDVGMENLDQLVKFNSLETFVYGITLWQKICAKSSNNVLYFYKFTCKSERNLMTNLLGGTELVKHKLVTCHADDLFYLFPVKVANQNVDANSETFKMIENVTKLWTNFVKYGNPTPDDSLGVKWNPYNLESENYLDIGESLVSGSHPDKEEIEFWEKVFSEYLPHYSANKT